MLLLIEESHKKSSDSNLLSSMNSMINLKQANFTSFPLWFSEFTTKSKEFTSLLVAASSTKEEVVGHLLKCIVLNNIDPIFFQYTIYGIQSAKKPMTLAEISEDLMGFYNNNTIVGDSEKISALSASTTSPSNNINSQPKKHLQKCKCERCGEDFPKAIDKRTHRHFKICKACATKAWNEAHAKSDTKTPEPGSDKDKKTKGSKASKAMNGASAVSSSEESTEE